MIGIFSKNQYIYTVGYTATYFFSFFLETTQKRQSEIVLYRYISEKPKERANNSKERAKRRVGRARSKKEAWEGALPPQKEGSSAAMIQPYTILIQPH